MIKEENSKAIFKYNNGLGALLCSNCRTIIKTGKDFTYYEKEVVRGNEELEAQYCKPCKKKIDDANRI